MKSIVGNEKAVSYLLDSLERGGLSHAYLFNGPAGVGKTKAGVAFARMLLCEGESPLDCTDCPSCKLFIGGNHPDFFHLEQETVLIEDIRSLISSLELKPYRKRGKVVLVSHAEKLTTQALNAFLKTLEEPDSKTTIILTSENKKNLLPTIVSRARIVNFGLLSDKRVFEYLHDELGVKKEMSNKISEISAGKIGLAINLANDENLANEAFDLITTFKRVYKSQDIWEKINFADLLSKDKETLLNKLQALELFVRGELIKGIKGGQNSNGNRELVVLLDKIAKSMEQINMNINTKLALEGLLFRGIR